MILVVSGFRLEGKNELSVRSKRRLFVVGVGFILSVLAIFTPGTGLLEIGALFTIVMADTRSIISLSTGGHFWSCWWSSTFVFAYGKRNSGTGWFRGYFIRYWFHIPGASGVECSIGQSSICGFHEHYFHWPVVVYRAENTWCDEIKALQDLKKLIGQIGEARTEIKNSGTVYVGGENWSARSETTIRIGSSVRVKERQGLVLLVWTG